MAKVIGDSTKAIAGVAVFSIAANALSKAIK
jgi:hypothetical protein